jgi:hypothetical protein
MSLQKRCKSRRYSSNTTVETKFVCRLASKWPIKTRIGKAGLCKARICRATSGKAKTMKSEPVLQYEGMSWRHDQKG